MKTPISARAVRRGRPGRFSPLALTGAIVLALCAAALARGDASPPPRTLSAWLPYRDQEGAYQDALAHADQLRIISPFVLVRSRAYDGIGLDYETIAATGDATYRTVGPGHTALLRDLCSGLHALGKVWFATVNPKTTTTGRIWDYRSLGQVADRVRILTYNLHYATGTPGPLSSTAWYDEILRRATAEIPLDCIELGLPAYGWDWAEGRHESGPARHLEGSGRPARGRRRALRARPRLAEPALHVQGERHRPHRLVSGRARRRGAPARAASLRGAQHGGVGPQLRGPGPVGGARPGCVTRSTLRCATPGGSRATSRTTVDPTRVGPRAR
ncbi:glycosyl hydrolase [Streptomyces sp. NPDC000188]|uniref:glycosyl hydrolase n=1 Tax=Streptomyces sp. NPDC000188 TaxID=3154245 RepID=UPI0026931329